MVHPDARPTLEHPTDAARIADTARTAHSRAWAAAALLLLAPVPSLTVLIWLHGATGAWGQAIAAIGKLWLIGLPVAWLVLRKGSAEVAQPLRISREKQGEMARPVAGLVEGLAWGLGIFAAIVGAYVAVGWAWIDAPAMRSVLAEKGLGHPWIYAGLAGYWCLVNALLEEYVWRWFIHERAGELLYGDRWPSGGVNPASRRWLAPALITNLLFGVHHALALGAYTDWRVTTAGTTGVCLGGMIWSYLLHRHGTLWPAYVSHVLADLAVFGVGAWIMLSGA
ncbi:MAG: CPBP family intramembrane metalloprotease [Phycisphaeraceae bacterium]|nr:CPBP family intramembrane metalloprotease [Phycisphaeraceae bacterium]